MNGNSAKDSPAQQTPGRRPLPADKRHDVPTVFLSYSHDSKEHKSWVASLAQRLMDNGVDVLFDQWDLGPGDDVPKFMEQAVAKADRVLMVCTEAYVRKADDGKGGVGYEAMVVTGELVQDLGTNKFIPIVRQSTSPASRPRCVNTRLYVDLSAGANADESFELLLREIHNAPKLAKPALGPNPFAAGTFKGADEQAAQANRRLEFADSLASPAAAYERALGMIRANDRVAWRKLLLAANERGVEGIKRWRTEQPDIPVIANADYAARFAHVLAGVENYASFIACLVAAAETGHEGYADQLGWVESILEPVGYDRSGTVYHSTFPQMTFFVAQALVGGMLMLSGAGEAAYRLATTKIADQLHPQEALPLFEMTPCNGWPEPMDHHCTIAWKFLDQLLSSWDWLKQAFGNERECRVAVSAYYQMLSFLNFIKLAQAGQLDAAQEVPGDFRVSVPLCFCVWPADVADAGYRSFLKQAPILRRVLEANQLAQRDFDRAWTEWMTVVGNWLGGVYRSARPIMCVPQRDLSKDLRSDPYSLA
jgi:hypothetical protein